MRKNIKPWRRKDFLSFSWNGEDARLDNWLGKDGVSNMRNNDRHQHNHQGSINMIILTHMCLSPIVDCVYPYPDPRCIPAGWNCPWKNTSKDVYLMMLIMWVMGEKKILTCPCTSVGKLWGLWSTDRWLVRKNINLKINLKRSTYPRIEKST